MDFYRLYVCLLFVALVTLCNSTPSQRNACLQALVAVLCSHVSRSLFNKDRLVFALHLSRHIPPPQAIVTSEGHAAAWEHLVTDSSVHLLAAATSLHPDTPKWIPQACRSAFNAVAHAHPRILQTFQTNEAAWAAWQESPEADKLPECSKLLTPLEQALVTKALRPEALLMALQGLAISELGAQTFQPGPLRLKDLDAEVGPEVPILFINAPGSDPCQELQAFAARWAFLLC
jgi:hypothetical protein